MAIWFLEFSRYTFPSHQPLKRVGITKIFWPTATLFRLSAIAIVSGFIIEYKNYHIENRNQASQKYSNEIHTSNPIDYIHDII